MDLSMILSPVLEEEQLLPPVPPRQYQGPNHKWSADELQCAVAILQDFQQPSANFSLSSQADLRSRIDAKVAPFYLHQEQRSKEEVQDPSNGIMNLSAHEVSKNCDQKHLAIEQVQKLNTSPTVWKEDSMSKLDLLVQADAIIKRRRSNALTSPEGDQTTYLRSGVWSRAEEEYAAAIVSFFLRGLLDLPEGVTLRKFLAEKLCCNRRRVSMKLGTESLAGQKIPRKVGGSVFVAADPLPSEDERREIESELAKLREANFSSGVLESRDYNEEGGLCLDMFKLDESGDEDDEKEMDTHQSYEKALGNKRPAVYNTLKPKRSKPTIIRTGFESAEEKEFVTAIYEYFTAGTLNIPEGTRLVTYLCQQLGCTPKQLSMKLAPQRLGERVFSDNVGSIIYVQRVTEAGNSSSEIGSIDDDFSEELFEVESRITELRLAHEEAHKNMILQVATPIKCERKTSTASRSSPDKATLTGTSSAASRSFRRSGPWSHDEEVYAAALIDSFFKGALDVTEGTTLRAFLSSRLCCNPMRISKKLASESIAAIPIPKKLGSSTYVRDIEVTSEERSRSEEALDSLRRIYIYSSSAKLSGGKQRRQSRGYQQSTSYTNSKVIESDSDAPSIAGKNFRKCRSPFLKHLSYGGTTSVCPTSIPVPALQLA
ncbi:hypothetical protein CCR75_006285 [Bremia lactucae]|uniref:Uncharacterized protein n=1 Tax=Bremia lactucae TaxID=4779 RepID=A0A976ILA2_BRELC|nr:hypothetical protein CCR75_006285 [Bremia lactucae]